MFPRLIWLQFNLLRASSVRCTVCQSSGLTQKIGALTLAGLPLFFYFLAAGYSDSSSLERESSITYSLGSFSSAYITTFGYFSLLLDTSMCLQVGSSTKYVNEPVYFTIFTSTKPFLENSIRNQRSYFSLRKKSSAIAHTSPTFQGIVRKPILIFTKIGIRVQAYTGI